MSAEQRVDQWMRAEADVAAPDRLLEDVFVRTEAAGQVRRGWRGRLRLAARGRLRAASGSRQRGLVGLAALVVVGLVGVSIGMRIGTSPGASTGSAAPSPGAPSAGPRRDLVVVRSHQTCARRGSLGVIPATADTRASAWVTCGADSEEVVLGSDTVTRRDGLGAIATDGTTEWAIHGDSVVELNPDRSVARSVRIGTPSAVAVGESTVWALDALTGRLLSIGPDGVERSVAPSPSGRVIAIAIANGSLWALDQSSAHVLRLDLRDGRLISAIPVAARPTILVQAAGALYAASPVSDTIVRIDPVDGSSSTLPTDLGPDGHVDALGGSADELVVGSRANVLRLDPRSGAVGAVAVGKDYVVAVGLGGSTLLVLTESGLLLEATVP